MAVASDEAAMTRLAEAFFADDATIERMLRHWLAVRAVTDLEALIRVFVHGKVNLAVNKQHLTFFDTARDSALPELPFPLRLCTKEQCVALAALLRRPTAFATVFVHMDNFSIEYKHCTLNNVLDPLVPRVRWVACAIEAITSFLASIVHDSHAECHKAARLWMAGVIRRETAAMVAPANEPLPVAMRKLADRVAAAAATAANI
jgi:hypothetical protein